MCPWGRLLLLQPLGLLVSQPRAGAGICTLPRLVSVLLVAVTQLPLALAALGGPLLGLGALGLHVERSHHLLELLHVLRDGCRRWVVLVAALAAVSSKLEVVRYSRHLSGAEVEAARHHLVADVQGQLVDKVRLEQHPIRLPCGSKASIDSIS